MIRVKDVMNGRVVTVDPDDTVEEAISLMLTHRVSGLPVVDMSGQMVGLLTEFDLLELVWDPGTQKNKVYHYMTRDPETVDEDADLADVARRFRTLPIRRLLVMRGRRVVGIISRRDLIRHVLRVRTCLAASLVGRDEQTVL